MEKPSMVVSFSESIKSQHKVGRLGLGTGIELNTKLVTVDFREAIEFDVLGF